MNKRLELKQEAFSLAFTDGGPDHNISFLNVMVSWLAFFIISGSDTLIVARTAPTQSWTNPVERLMYVLNLALSNCALAREIMGEDFEKNMKKCNSMASVRKMAKQLDSTNLVATEVSSAHVHVTANVVANASSSGVDIATTSTEARLSGALLVVTGVHQSEEDFDLSQEFTEIELVTI